MPAADERAPGGAGPPAPDITCVIPTFNNLAHLPGALRSVLSQPGVRVEAVLVDDASDAPAREQVAALAAGDARVRALFLSPNGGQAQARNIGAAIARGRFIAFLDQDDEHEPGWYAHAIALLDAHAAYGAVSGRARFVDIPPRLGVAHDDLRLQGLSHVFATNIVFRTAAFRASGGFPADAIWRGPGAGEDSALRIGFGRNWSLGGCDAPALVHRVRDGGATAYFLERTSVRDGRVVVDRFEAIETDGRLARAREAFREEAARGARELRACVPREGEG